MSVSTAYLEWATLETVFVKWNIITCIVFFLKIVITIVRHS